MINLGTLSARALAAAIFCSGMLAHAQQSFTERFAAHNATMASLQPAMVTPLVAADPRLIQYVRLAVSNEFTPSGTETMNYGNARGAGLIAFRRFEFDAMPPAYIQHNSTAIDGFGDTNVSGKVRIASGDAEHGNFEVSTSLVHCFATGSHKNGALTDSFTPALVGDYTIRRVSFISALGGSLPTGKIATQGRSIAWNESTQIHAIPHLWFEVENNATFYFAGPHDGMMQNFITPAAFYVLRRKDWKPTHPFAVFASGMQIATSGFHTYNHNLISDVRILF
ncbi:MAG: hypothetical protein ACLPH3_26010 [Terracidiphilus sp.]